MVVRVQPSAAEQTVDLRPLFRDLMCSVTEHTTGGGRHCVQLAKDRLYFG